jgi:ribose transport system permease protein
MTMPHELDPSITTAEPLPRRTIAGRLRSGGDRRFPETGVLFIVLLALVVFFALKSPFFFQWDNFVNIVTAVAVVGVVACAATMLLIAGQFDLSVGSGVALVTVMFAYALDHGSSILVAVLIAVAVGLAIGLVNGFVVTVVGVNALITTLGTLAIARGLAQLRSDGQGIGFEGFQELSLSKPLLDLSWGVWIFLAVVAGAAIVMRSTIFGRTLYTIGANPVAARLAGLPVKRTIFIGFVVSGLAMALAGLILASQTGQGSGNAANGMELSAITAVILGGASLAGGRGTILGTLLGLLIIGVINNGLVLLDVQAFWQDVIRGALLILAVGFDQVRQRLAAA